MVQIRTTVKPQPGLFLQPHVLDQLIGQLIQGVVEGSEVTGAEYAVSSWLGVVGRCTPTRLAEETGLGPTTLSAMIERLVAKGQVRRLPNPDDGRSYLLELTARGRKTHERNGARLLVEIAAVREHLEGDPEEILAAMRLLEAALRKRIADESPDTKTAP